MINRHRSNDYREFTISISHTIRDKKHDRWKYDIQNTFSFLERVEIQQPLIKSVRNTGVIDYLSMSPEFIYSLFLKSFGLFKCCRCCFHELTFTIRRVSKTSIKVARIEYFWCSTIATSLFLWRNTYSILSFFAFVVVHPVARTGRQHLPLKRTI